MTLGHRAPHWQGVRQAPAGLCGPSKALTASKSIEPEHPFPSNFWDYDSEMARRALTIAVLLAAAPTGAFLVNAPAASASVLSIPIDNPNEESWGCEFTLSAPRLAELPGGLTAVTATLTPGHCTGNVQPMSSTVCVATPSSPGECASRSGYDPAQVFVALGAPPPGTYTATGNGCWRSGDVFVTKVCRSQGTTSASI